MTAPPESHWPATQIKPFLDYLTVECGLADNTIQAYRRDLSQFTLFCRDHHHTDVRKIDPVVMQGFARFLSGRRLASASVARNLVAVRMFLRYHVLFGMVERDVCSILETPKIWQRLPKVLSRQQTVDLITALDAEEPMYPRDRALLEMLYATGMRASEIAALRLGDVNFQIAYLRCFGKGSKERIIPVHKLALDILREYVQTLRNDLVGEKNIDRVFVSRTGRGLSRIEVWRIVRRAARRAGLSGRVSPHTLRHCFGSHLLQGGADLRIVQELLGHADVTTTQIYTHVDQDHLRNVHKKYHPMA